MKVIQVDDVVAWYQQNRPLAQVTRSIGSKQVDPEFLETEIGVPVHLRVLLQQLAAKSEAPLADDVLNSISFYSLCRGLFLPLAFLEPDRTAQFFGLITEPAPDAAGREKVVETFLAKEVGLSLREKLGCVLGDPFLGRRSSFRRDSLLRLLMSLQMRSRRNLLDRLTQVGDVAVLFAESRRTLKVEPALTAAEVLRLLQVLPDLKQSLKFDVLRSVLERCGKLEAYFLAKLLLRKAGFGFDYQGPLIARLIARQFKVPEEQVAHAIALTDSFNVVEVLDKDGAAGLKAIQLQPLVPVRPSLAGGITDDLTTFPVWVERKYDGIRLMLHKSTDQFGSMLCGAYTRTRGDWLEQIPGIDITIKALPVRNAILDGELYGTVMDLEGVRPASVYEVYASLQGQPIRPVSLKYAAFDVLYLNGQDLTGQSLSARRQYLSMAVQPLASVHLPIPMTLAEGQMANHKDDVNRLFHHFRAQGYEGVITKDLNGPYLLSTRDPNWMKRKPEITLDLVVMGATYAVTTKENAGLFGSYVIGARLLEGGFQIVGDVAGLDRVRDAEIQQEIMREGLLTGRRIERPSASGVRPGVELRPEIVITVKFEGIVKDQVDGRLSLRDPKVVMIRSDKSSSESDTTRAIEELYLRQRVG